MKALFRLVLVICALASPGEAQQLSGLAKFNPDASEIVDAGSGVQIDLGLSQAVPWRVRVLDDPARLVVDFREVDWTRLADMPQASDAVVALRAGVFRPGWSRLVIELAGPMQVTSAEMRTSGGVGVHLRLEPATRAAFAALAALPEPADWTLPKPVDLPAAPKQDGKLVVVLDPGHGGIDPGAERDGQNEKTLVLKFARELKEALLRDGGFDVVMTRDADVFVPLETRISIAHQAGADVFLSLHADAIAEGDAVGATIYSLSADASDAASAALAERHDRDDLLAGVDLSQQDDLVAEVLMDMARTDTSPRTERLAMALEVAIKAQGLKMHRHPRQQASFSVLKSADIPSVLLELGFLSSARDLKRLDDPKWRAKMAEALVSALKAWAKQDAGLQALPLK
ncbi:N-acetylmuramoyl-L-alanine amidase [Cypionkella sp. TWP1-2-1b2]|uniref:N-acetylmuramoyl-L-alanine amidase n=1 Tax=Cypionkella sp. TWP1-2-1b2 TaxID=2804675 RepID=UPI003CFB4E26